MNVSPTDRESSTPKIGCECIEKSSRPDGALAKRNTRLNTNIHISRETGAISETVTLSTSVLAKKRGARPVLVIPNYCPFCGTRYVAAAPQADDDAGARRERPCAGS